MERIAQSFKSFALFFLPFRLLLPKDSYLLHVAQAFVVAVEGKKFFMAAAFHNLSFVQHTDFISIADGGQAVGNSDGGAVLHQVLQRLLHHLFRFRVEGGGRFVQNQDGRVLQDGAGDAHPLALPAGQFAAPVAYHGVVSLFAGHDEVVGVGYLGGFNHLLHRGVLHAESNVVEERVVEQDGFLVHIPHQAPQALQGDVFHVHPINEDSAFLHIVIAGQEVNERGFPGAGLADERHGLSLFYREVDVAQHPRVLVLERHVAVFNLLLQRGQRHGAGGFFDVVFGQQYFVDAFHRCQAFGDVVAGL